MNLGDKLKVFMPLVEDMEKMLNKDIEAVLKLESKRLQTAKDGKKFLLMTLSDRTGSVRAIDWYNAEKNDSEINEGNILMVKGKPVIFDGRLQINISKDEDAVRVLKEGEFDPERFVRKSRRDPEEMFRDLMKMVDSISDSELRDFLRVIFRSLRDDLLMAPAAVKHHHAYIGGLLEHSLNVAKMVEFVSKTYGVNRDMAVAGALLHDIGKIKEYVVKPSGIEVSTEGELKGHIVIGVEMVRSFARKSKLSKSKLLELEHIIISHHGQMELGSPVIPKTPEALIVHFVENMDSKVSKMLEIIQGTDGDWSEYDRSLGRRVYVSGR